MFALRDSCGVQSCAGGLRLVLAVILVVMAFCFGLLAGWFVLVGVLVFCG